MKNRITTCLVALLLITIHAQAFDYNGLSYRPTGDVDKMTLNPTCEVTGFASDNPNGQVVNIPAAFAIDPETNTPYWPIKIAPYAFKGTKAAVIESLGTVQEIGEGAFYNTRIMGDLSSITVMKVGDYAFYSCNVLASVNFAACMEIGEHAFDGCNILVNAVFPLVQKIGQSAFYNCELLQHFELPITLESLGRYAFAGCKDLDQVSNLSEKLLKEIPFGCFQGCEDLREFHFPSCVKKIEGYAFDGCSSLDKISIPAEVEYVGECAFKDCKQATLAYIHGCNTQIHGGWVNGSVFSGCSAIEEVRLCRTKESVPFYVLFPDSKKSLKRVRILEGSTSIGKAAMYGSYETEFGGYVNLEQVEIPEGVTMIGCIAFQGCSSLKSITLPQSLDSICPSAFKLCGLRTIEIPDNVNYIGSSAFEQCVNLRYIKWSNNLTNLPWYVCYNDSALLEVDLPVSITSIGRGAFENCVSLSSVTIPGRQTEWENDYFKGCPNIKKLSFISDGKTPQISTLLSSSKNALEEVTLLPGSTCLGTINSNKGVFSYATLANFGRLQKVYIPEGVTMIGYQAFEGDTMLTNISLPTTIDTIGGYAFRKTNIEKVVLPQRVKYIAEYTFDGCKYLREVAFNKSLSRIGTAAFQNCISLTTVDLPFSVSVLETTAFAGCTGIKSITIGDNLTSLKDRVFMGCSSLEKITCYTKEVLENISAFEYSPFYSIGKECILYVPTSSLDAYKKSWYWDSYFKDILPIGATPTTTNTLTITPTESTAEITWPVGDDDFLYILTIFTTSGEEVCRVELYYDGEMIDTRYNMSHRMPAKTREEQEGLSYKIIGLDQGTTYKYELQTLDTKDRVIAIQSGTFTTPSFEAIENVATDGGRASKIMENGSVYIVLENGTKYTITGKQVK